MPEIDARRGASPFPTPGCATAEPEATACLLSLIIGLPDVMGMSTPAP